VRQARSITLFQSADRHGAEPERATQNEAEGAWLGSTTVSKGAAMALEIGCIFPPTVDTPDHLAVAERLGYAYGYVYDSPTLFADPWLTLARGAERTSRIRLGVCCITPYLRHVVATANALATLEALAPGRINLVIGAGFTGQRMIGRGPGRWADVEAYAAAVRGLLTEEEVEWEGAVIGLRYSSRTGLPLPAQVPIWIAAHGPRGVGVAERVADAIMTDPAHGSGARSSVLPVFVNVYGTVLDEGEDLSAERVRDAAGPYAAFQLHLGGEGVVSHLPEWGDFRREIDAIDPRRRHLETHRSHLIDVTERERPLITPELITQATSTGTAAEVRGRLEELAARGVSGVLYGPQGGDPERELEAFARAAHLAPAG
jgi:5,10-methylenetetrahydromethanopterin reductase